jgi:hypothetical protein
MTPALRLRMMESIELQTKARGGWDWGAMSAAQMLAPSFPRVRIPDLGKLEPSVRARPRTIIEDLVLTLFSWRHPIDGTLPASLPVLCPGQGLAVLHGTHRHLDAGQERRPIRRSAGLGCASAITFTHLWIETAIV